jgi:uncharacterized membrane protein YfcA
MLSYAFASLVGLSLGLLGSGGSVLAVPILKYTAGLSAKQAVATSLATVGAVSFIGALLAWRQGRVAWREAGIFSVVATMGTYGGVKIAHQLSDQTQMGIFVAVMAYAVYRMAKSPDKAAQKPANSTAGAALKALSVGVLTGVVGVGGGFLIVPALVALFDLPMKRATGTSLVVISVNSLVGTLSYSTSVTLDWGFTAGFVMAALVGLVLGIRWSRDISDQKLKNVFAFLLAVVCIYTGYREFF